MCDRFPRKFDVQTSNNALGLIFVVNIKFPQATYHTIVPSTEELYCSIITSVVEFPVLRVEVGGANLCFIYISIPCSNSNIFWTTKERYIEEV